MKPIKARWIGRLKLRTLHHLVPDFSNGEWLELMKRDEQTLDMWDRMNSEPIVDNATGEFNFLDTLDGEQLEEMSIENN